MKSNHKIIIATNGTVGDVLPFCALAQALSTRGHSVHILLPKFYESLAISRGLDYSTFGTAREFQSVLDDPDLWNERKAMSVVWRLAAPYLEVIKDMVTQQPIDTRCLLLCHPFMVPAANIAKVVRADLRIVSAFMAPSNLCSAHDFPTAGSLRIPSWAPLWWRKLLWQIVFKWVIDPAYLPQLNACRAANQLRPVESFLPHMIHDADVMVGLFPRWYGAKQPDWPANFLEGEFPVAALSDPGGLSAPLESFLARGDAPIVFTPGTGHRHAKEYFAAALQALPRLRRRGLFITPHADQVPKNLPLDVLWIDRAPFDLLLSRVAAVVHHGGIGTTAQAFRSGTPQLIVPYAFDQFDNAFRAQQLGVAEVVLPPQLSARRLHKHLARLLASITVARSCAKLAERAADAKLSSRLIDQVEAALNVSC